MLDDMLMSGHSGGDLKLMLEVEIVLDFNGFIDRLAFGHVKLQAAFVVNGVPYEMDMGVLGIPVDGNGVVMTGGEPFHEGLAVVDQLGIFHVPGLCVGGVKGDGGMVIA